MKKKTLVRAVVILLAAAMLLTVLLPAITIFSRAAVTQDDIDELEDELAATEERRKQVEEELASIRNDLDKAEEAVTLAQEQVLLAEQKIGYIQSLINATQQEIDATQQRIETSQARLDDLDGQITRKEADILELEAQEVEQYQEFYAQVRWMEETGPVSYLSILFEASSFSEMLDYATLIADIMDYSNRIIHRLEDTQTQLRAARDDLQDTRDAQAAVQQELEEQKTQQEEQKAQQEAQKADLVAQKAQLDRDKAAAVALMNQIAASESNYAQQARALAAEEAQLEKDLKAAQELYAQQLANLQNDGAWYWPLPGKYGITSLFGGRISPITGRWESHTGTDIGDAPAGTEIHAAQNGIVTLVGTNRYSSYGYYCIISHANGYATLYAHQSRPPLVKEGQTVQKGQVIGYVGSTGSSTAPHLHFELRINGVRADVLQLYPNTTFHGYGYTWKGNNYPPALRIR